MGGVNDLSIQSWNDFATMCLKNPRELIASMVANEDGTPPNKKIKTVSDLLS